MHNACIGDWFRRQIPTVEFLRPDHIPIAQSDRTAPKASILPLLTASPSRSITVQLTATLKDLVAHDLSDRWGTWEVEMSRKSWCWCRGRTRPGITRSLEKTLVPHRGFDSPAQRFSALTMMSVLGPFIVRHPDVKGSIEQFMVHNQQRYQAPRVHNKKPSILVLCKLLEMETIVGSLSCSWSSSSYFTELFSRIHNKKKAVALPVSSLNGPKTRRGRHGVNKQFEKLQTYLGSGMREERLEWIDSLHQVEQISVYPSTFVRTTKDKKHVERAMQEQYPHGFTASQLPIFDPPNSFSITPPEEHEEAQRAWHPPILAARFCNVITERGQNVLITAWDVVLPWSGSPSNLSKDLSSQTQSSQYGTQIDPQQLDESPAQQTDQYPAKLSDSKPVSVDHTPKKEVPEGQRSDGAETAGVSGAAIGAAQIRNQSLGKTMDSKPAKSAKAGGTVGATESVKEASAHQLLLLAFPVAIAVPRCMLKISKSDSGLTATSIPNDQAQGDDVAFDGGGQVQCDDAGFDGRAQWIRYDFNNQAQGDDVGFDGRAQAWV
ncbi:hypothetical protein BDR03DRAFT_987169 [Suillus americanus]|nr:hypothetical protein BDR03DRAFT_987169 [Suillus americanus]